MGFTLVSPYSLKPLKGSKQSSIKHPYPFPRLPHLFSVHPNTKKEGRVAFFFFKVSNIIEIAFFISLDKKFHSNTRYFPDTKSI